MDKTILKNFAITSRYDLMKRIEGKIKLFYADEDFEVQQNGDIYVLSNEKHILRLLKDEYEKRELLIKRIKELGLAQVIEEAAYTWFNRIVAIRYMEVNDYLPLSCNNQSLGIRVLSNQDNAVDPEIMKFSNLINEELDIDFKKEKYIELQETSEKFKYVLLLVCKKLGKVIPQVFGGVTDYIDILIPDNLLNDTGFVTKIIKEIPEDNYKQVEIIGWLYQYYNQTEKNRVISLKKAYKKNEIPYATQLFTPDWIVKYMVENSLGRYFVEHSGNYSIIKNWKYFVTDEIDIKKDNINPVDITFIDPCCGSGHILVYAFEVLYQIYESIGYNKNDIAELILKHNLYGLDIDDRAYQLSILSILLKAREYDRNIFNKNIILNIHSIKESNNIPLSILDNIRSDKQREVACYLLDKFNDAKEIGSLLLVEEKDYKEIISEIEADDTLFSIDVKDKILPLVKQADMLSTKYDIVVTNPPYLSSSVMSSNLKGYLAKNYKCSKNDLCTAFMEINFIKPTGYMAMINQHSWMFLASFIDFRSKIIDNYSIQNMIHLGARAFEDIAGEIVQTTSFILSQEKSNKPSIFYKLNMLTNAKLKEQEFLENKEKYKHVALLDEFNKMPSKQFAYWVSKSFLNNFEDSKYIDDYGILTGSQNITGDNNKYLRNWWEVNNHKINDKWFFYSKGGDYKKYYGNLDLVVDWSSEAKKFYKENKTSNLLSEDLWFREGISYSAITSIAPSFRYFPSNCLFDKGGPAIIMNKELYQILGLLNSKVAEYYLNVFNSTVNIQTRDIKSFPIKELDTKIDDLVKEQINISKFFWDYKETSIDYKKCLLINGCKTISSAITLSDSLIENYINKYIENQEKINSIVIDAYKLNDELTCEVLNDLDNVKMSKVSHIKSFISYAVGCMFGRYSNCLEGLIYAGGDFDISKYKSYKPDVDNIIPITDEAYFNDDITSRFRDFVKLIYGEDTLNENLDFIAEVLGRKGTETSEDTIRRYFNNDFYMDHVRIYQKRPIYFLFDSGKKNGFKALVYIHRYNENIVPKIRLDYLHRMQTTYEKLLVDVSYKLTKELSVSEKREALKYQTNLNCKLQEIREYDEKIAHVANKKISIDLDDGVIENYSKFEDILAKIK